ncbi:MAG: GspH/FimT family protein [Pseudomonadota bacterium]
MRPHRGFTLFELIAVVAIAALLAAFAVPSLIHLVRDHRATAAMNGMLGRIQLARATAISLRRNVTLCPGAPGATDCGKRDTWHDGSLLFVDSNRNGRMDGSDYLVRGFPPLRNGERFRWRSFRNKKSLTLRPSGLTDWQNGHLQYCPPANDARLARQAIINAQARVRSARDSDGDGIREDARGRPLRCPML